MMILYTILRVVLSTLIVFYHLRLKYAEWRHDQALEKEKDKDNSMLEQMRYEHSIKLWERRIPRLSKSVSGLQSFRDRVASFKGLVTPYLLGTIDASLLWLVNTGSLETVLGLFQ